jgi:hypothetical protein
VHGERNFFGWQAKSLKRSTTLPFPVKHRLSLFPRNEAGTRLVVSVPSVSIRFFIRISKSLSRPERRLSFRPRGEHHKPLTALEIRIERIERMRKRIAFVIGWGAVLMESRVFLLATEVPAGNPLFASAVANRKWLLYSGAISPGLYRVDCP